MKLVRDALAADSHISDALDSKKRIIAPSSLHPFLAAIRANERPLLIVTGSSRTSEDLVNDLRELHECVFEFPAWETLPHERLSPRSDTVAQRISTLIELSKKQSQNPIVVTPVRGLIHRIINSLAQTPIRELVVGGQCDLKELIDHLGKLAYQRTDLVERRGEFAVRGGIVDVFLPLAKQPVRIDFFGDEIEEIESLDITTGKRIGIMDNAAIFPANLYLAPKEILQQIISEIQDEAAAQVEYFKQSGKYIEAQRLSERVNFDLEMIRELGYCNGVENYSRFFDRRSPGTRPFCLLDYFPDDFLCVIDESHQTIPQVSGM